MNSTGPSGSSSIGFSTGSVVVPGWSETIATSCRVIAFSRLDFPTLRRPNVLMCRRRSRGADCVIRGGHLRVSPHEPDARGPLLA
jgi:hypothetical protein